MRRRRRTTTTTIVIITIYIYISIHPFQSHLKGTTGNDALQKSAAGPTGLWHGQAPHMAHKSLLSTMILIVYLKIILCLWVYLYIYIHSNICIYIYIYIHPILLSTNYNEKLSDIAGCFVQHISRKIGKLMDFFILGSQPYQIVKSLWLIPKSPNWAGWTTGYFFWTMIIHEYLAINQSQNTVSPSRVTTLPNMGLEY